MFYDVGLVFVFVVRIFLEILEMYESNSCAWMCSAIAIFCARFGSCLYVRVSGYKSMRSLCKMQKGKRATTKFGIKINYNS
jgi:hypothetical protein